MFRWEKQEFTIVLVAVQLWWLSAAVGRELWVGQKDL